MIACVSWRFAELSERMNGHVRLGIYFYLALTLNTEVDCSVNHALPDLRKHCLCVEGCETDANLSLSVVLELQAVVKAANP